MRSTKKCIFYINLLLLLVVVQEGEAPEEIRAAA
jgi:hypothetical protein